MELQDDLIREFVERTKDMERPKDMDKITREFFMVSQELGKLGEQLICSGNYDYISRKITDSILGQTWKNVYKNPYFQNIIVSFISQGTLAIYKKWVADKKQIPLEDIIQLSIQLICNGINSLNPE